MGERETMPDVLEHLAIGDQLRKGLERWVGELAILIVIPGRGRDDGADQLLLKAGDITTRQTGRRGCGQPGTEQLRDVRRALTLSATAAVWHLEPVC